MGTILSKDWRTQTTRKATKQFAVTSLGADILVKPMTSGRLFEIEGRFPVDDDNGRITDYPAYMRAVIADSVIAEDGRALWTEDEVKNELDTESFWEIWEAVGTFLGLKKTKGEPAKN